MGARDRGGMCCIKGRNCIGCTVEEGLGGTVSCGPVLLLCMSSVQVYSNSSEVATLYPNQTSFTFKQLTPGTLYLMSVGGFTDAGEGEREKEELLVQVDNLVTKCKTHILQYSTHVHIC